MSQLTMYGPNQPERTVRVYRNPAPEQRANTTVDHLSKGWIPANPNVLKKIHSRLEIDQYASSSDELIEDIKSDLALTSHCFRNMRQVIPDFKGSVNPLKDLRQATPETISRLVSVGPSQISTFKLSDTSRFQALQMKQLIVATEAAQTIAAEVKAQGMELENDEVYSCALIRQLGLSLIAWNYPHAYARALEGARAGRFDFEDYLGKLLGISPQGLALKFASDWAIDPNIRAGIRNPKPEEVKELISRAKDSPGQAQRLIGSICAASESLAHLNDPETYKNSSQAWEIAAEELEALIGPEAVRNLPQTVANKTSARLIELASGSGKNLWPGEQSEIEDTSTSQKLFFLNNYAKQCPEEVQTHFKRVYLQIDADTQASATGLQTLLTEVIPALGFAAGCIYLLDHKSSKLVPKIRLGQKRDENVPAVDYRLSNSVAQSFFRDTPLRQAGINKDGKSVAEITASLGKKRDGVLALEVSPTASQDPGHDAVLYFKAVRQCLNDCLG